MCQENVRNIASLLGVDTLNWLVDKKSLFEERCNIPNPPLNNVVKGKSTDDNEIIKEVLKLEGLPRERELVEFCPFNWKLEKITTTPIAK